MLTLIFLDVFKNIYNFIIIVCTRYFGKLEIILDRKGVTLSAVPYPSYLMMKKEIEENRKNQNTSIYSQKLASRV